MNKRLVKQGRPITKTKGAWQRSPGSGSGSGVQSSNYKATPQRYPQRSRDFGQKTLKILVKDFKFSKVEK